MTAEASDVEMMAPRRRKILPQAFHDIVLICSDDDICNFVVRDLNESGKYAVEGFSSVEAFETASYLELHVICLCIPDKPDRSYTNIIKHFRSTYRQVPIIVISDDEVELCVKYLASGATDYIGKPFAVHELAARIDSALRTVDELRMPASALLPATRRLEVLSSRIDTVADNISALRINSTTDSVADLRSLSAELLAAAVSQDGSKPSEVDSTYVREGVQRSLPILVNLYDRLASRQGAEMVVAGAVSGIVGLGGWPAATVYGLSIAAWMGKDTFVKSVEPLMRRGSGRDSKS